MNPLAATERISTADRWVLGLITDQNTGSQVLDTALAIMRGEALPALAPSSGMLALVEPWLANRPQQAWNWIRRHPPEWRQYLGAWIQAGADRQGVELIDGPMGPSANSESLEILRLEQIARHASVGRTSSDDPRLQVDAGYSPAPVAAAIIAVWANLDAARGLQAATQALERQHWEPLRDAVVYCLRKLNGEPSARAETQAFLRDQVATKTMLIDGVAWTEAATFGSALEPKQVRERLGSLAAAVVDTVEQDYVWRAAYPLLRTAIISGCPDILYPHLTEWGIGAWEVIDLLISQDRRDDGAWALVDHAKADLAQTHMPGWWQAAQQSGTLDQTLSLIRGQLAAGAAQGLPCQPHHLWSM